MVVKQQNDFKLDELVTTSAEHEKSLEEIGKSLKNIENRVGTDSQLAESFKLAFEQNKHVDEMLTTLVINLIQKNNGVKEAIENEVRGIDRKWVNSATKTTLKILGAVILLLIGGIIQAVCSKFIK